MDIIESIRQALRRYQKANEHFAAVKVMGLPRPPETPEAITSQEDYDFYTRAWDTHTRSVAAYQKLHGDAEADLAKARNELKAAIPAINIWFRVDGWAVGKHWDDWGGSHIVLDIKPWSGSLPELHDVVNRD